MRFLSLLLRILPKLLRDTYTQIFVRNKDFADFVARILKDVNIEMVMADADFWSGVCTKASV